MPGNYVDNARQNFSHTTKSMGIRVCKLIASKDKVLEIRIN